MDPSFEIEVKKTNIDVSSILSEVIHPQVSHMWKHYGDLLYAFRKTETLRLFGPSDVDTSNRTADNLFNSTRVENLSQGLFPETLRWLHNNTLNLQRSFFLKLLPLQQVPLHKDPGKYFETIERYHLAIKGRYQYYVGNSNVLVVPGTLFCFNTQKLHGTQNLNNEDRITLVFDISKPL